MGLGLSPLMAVPTKAESVILAKLFFVFMLLLLISGSLCASERRVWFYALKLRLFLQPS